MGKNLASLLNQQYKKGVEDGGLYWTSVMVLAMYNLYGWKKAFDKIEAEMERIDKELKGDTETKIYSLAIHMRKIRGEEYWKSGD